MPYKDPEKRREAALKNYHKYKHELARKQRRYLSTKARRIKVRKIMEKYKNQPCLDCGNRFPPECMDFDHVMGEKKTDVSRLINTGHAITTVLKEAAKCELICSNCHRTRTKKRRNNEKTH